MNNLSLFVLIKIFQSKKEKYLKVQLFNHKVQFRIYNSIRMYSNFNLKNKRFIYNH